MAILYEEALRILDQIAIITLSQLEEPTEWVRAEESCGRIAAQSYLSPVSSPPFDTSAMDGYAISSAATKDASRASPVVFTIKGVIAAGDEPIILQDSCRDSLPCVEIMTGGRFPKNLSGLELDACVKVEDVCRRVKPSGVEQEVEITQPIAQNANRRFAGSDFHKGDHILTKGTVIQARHIMALASIGIAKVAVRRRLRVAIWSTGSELEGSRYLAPSSQIKDANGPYLTAALAEIGVHVEFKGVLEDSPENFMRALNGEKGGQGFDVLLASGAVSKGRFDFIAPTLKVMGANIHFHGVAIRPGHPILFATLPFSNGKKPFFGLPGNPVATAACFRFLVISFIVQVMGRKRQDYFRPFPGRIEKQCERKNLEASCPSHLDCFRHGSMHKNDRGENVVVLSEDQSPGKVSYFAASDCWVHIPRRPIGVDSDTDVYCYPHSSTELA